MQIIESVAIAENLKIHGRFNHHQLSYLAQIRHHLI